MNSILFALIGLLTGVIFGFIGDAATAAVVPLLLMFKAVPSAKHAIGTSMGMLLPPVGITGAYQYYKNGYVRWLETFYVLIGSTIGIYLGSLFSTKKIISRTILYLILCRV